MDTKLVTYLEIESVIYVKQQKKSTVYWAPHQMKYRWAALRQPSRRF